MPPIRKPNEPDNVRGFAMRPTRKILYLVILDTLLVALMTGLILSQILPAYPWASLSVGVLFLANALIAIRIFHCRSTENRLRASGLLWFATCVFTAGALAAMFLWFRSPSLGSAVQAIVAALLAGYLWFVISRVGRKQRSIRPN